MKKYKTLAMIYYMTSITFYGLAITFFIESTTKTMGCIYIALASAWLCIGSMYLSKAKKDKDKEE